MRIRREPDAGSKVGIGRLVRQAAQEVDAAATVVAHSTGGGVQEALLGSVTNWLIHNSDK